MAEPRRSTPALQGVAGARLLIVEARFYDDIGEMQLTGARAAVAAAGATCEVLSMPGALEIPAAMAIAVDQAAAAGKPFDGVVALGCIIRGETYHFEIVSNESARALMDLSVSRKLPLGNGILTVENEAQAIVRADPQQGDKGGDAVRAALALVSLVRAGAR
ncbi:MAG: 6,7-dimethyl-8-ribityllumazine synthase, partial [Hyphomicrobiales bacterium]|jgi:6,7-dimethyl-8-ribityllumazine synthase|nr:6,7-dimethyl-8-ribityllumazine synthase [Hyphomicrobiales bacterium]